MCPLQEGKTLEGFYEKLYNMVLGNIPFSLLLFDRSLRVVSANRNFLIKSRRFESETIGAKIREVFPEAILNFTNLEGKVRNVFDTGEGIQNAQMTYRAPGVSTRIYYYTLIPVKSGNIVEHTMLVMDDVTEKVQLSEKARMAERHLASVVESANDLVVSTDAEGQIISWNLAAERISGFHKDQVKGKRLSELCEPSQRHNMEEILHRLAKGNAVQFHEINIVSTSGKLIPIDWCCSPIRDDSGNVYGVVEVGRDLSERRAFEAHLLHTEKLAALGVMAGGIAHELRNPLSVSYSAAQFLLEADITPSFHRECAHKIINGIQRASSIIENLLRFARPAPSDHVEPLNLVTLVNDTVNVLAPQAKLLKIRVIDQYETDEIPISGNANLLQQVFMNFILNACQAMPDGGEIRIAVYQQQKEAVVEVSDNGCGITASNISQIFDPFFTTQMSGKGTGLGLSICHTIIQQHKGLIEVDSVIHHGSTFTVRLPLRQLPDVDL